MRTGHLFAGAGGGILADLILGHQPIVAVEWDAYACAVLRERFPGLRVIEGDVRAVDFTRELAGIDALCAGFPCQDISAAGRGAGIDGERSGLYREVIRAVDAVRPEWVFLENSPLIRTRGRHIVIGDLVARGYAWRDGQLAASDVGAPHKRSRWWCLARRTDADGARELQQGRRVSVQRRWAGDVGEEVANPNSILGLQGWPSDSEEVPRGRDADRGGQRADVCNADREGLAQWEGQPGNHGQEQPAVVGADWWATEPGVGVLADGMAPGSLRCRALREAAQGEIDGAEGGSTESVRALRQAIDQKAQRCGSPGGLGLLSSAPTLFPRMREQSIGADAQRYVSLAGAPDARARLCGLWRDGGAPGTSHRPQPEKQRPGEREDAMRLVSHEAALERGQAG